MISEPSSAGLTDTAVGHGFAEVIDYWFGDLADTVAPPEDDVHLRRWWAHDAAIDAEIAARFGPLVEAVAARAAAGRWPRDPSDLLAMVIVLDQLPRNIHRGTAAMYAHDGLALTASRTASDRFDPLAGDLFRAGFVFMPLMHAEDMSAQHDCVARFAAIAAEAERRGSPDLGYFSNCLDFAERHRAVVARFGRFPHRNALLGRPSSPEEEAFLREPGSSF